MKRILLLILLISVAFGAKANHWTPNSGPYANTATVIGVIRIDGVEQTSTTIEVGAFQGDECRGSAMPIYVSQIDRYILFMSLYGNDGDMLSFRLYDHTLNQELSVSCSNTVTFAANGTYGSGASPYVLSFERVIITHAITAAVDPVEGGSVTGTGTYEQGTAATLTATAATGYTFVNWTEDGVVVSADMVYNFTVTGPRDLVAHFSLNHYEVSAAVNPSAGGSVTGAGSYNHGSSATLTATAATGYTFVNWTEDDVEVSTSATYTFTVTETRSLVAHFSLNQYEITASVDPDAGGIVTGAGSYDYYTAATLTATAATGYTFLNWTEDGVTVSSNPSYTFTVTGARTLVAHFTLDTYYIVVSADPMEGGAVTGAGSFHYGSTAVIIATAATGYTFVNWTENGEVVSTNPAYTFTVTGHRILTANFLSEEEGGHWIPNTGAYANTATLIGVIQIDGMEQTSMAFEVGAFCGDECRGSGMPMFVPQLNRYILFMTLYGNDGDVLSFRLYDHDLGQESNLICTNTLTFEANGIIGSGSGLYVLNFEHDASFYAIEATADPSEGGAITGAGSYLAGTTVTLIATAATGYTFVQWTENGVEVSADPAYTITVTEDRTLVAHFSLNSYEITAMTDPMEGGTVAGAGSFDHGTTATLTATAAPGYTFIHWTENGEEVSADLVYSFVVTEDRELEAHFSLNNYEVTAAVDPVAGGVVTGAGSYDHGTTATLVATASTGYAFVHWTEDGEEVSTEPVYTFTVMESRNLVACFSLNSYEIVASANPDAGGNIMGAGAYDHGVTATLIATAASGYTFVRWTEDGTTVSTNPEYSFTVSCSRTLVAHFSLNTYYIVVSSDPMEGGAVMGAGSYDYGSTAILTASAATGYTFVNWTENGEEVSTNETYTFTVTGHRTLTAHFIAEEVSSHWTPSMGSYANTATLIGVIQIDSVEQATANLEVGVFCGDECRGSGVPMYVPQLDRYILFMTLYGNDGDVLDFRLYDHELGQECDLTCATTLTFEANGIIGSGSDLYVLNFMHVLPTYEITVTLDPAEGGTVTGAGIYTFGSTATLTATAATGYTFINWTEDGEEVSSASVCALTVTEDHHYVANFFEIVIDSTNHWIPQTSYPDHFMLIGVIQLQEVEQRTTTLEVGVFCGDECRGSQQPVYYPDVDRYLLWLTIYGQEGDELIFKLFNHDNGEEVEVQLSESLAFNTEGYGTLSNPYVLDFKATATGLPIEVPITLISGWNWISCMLTTETPIEEALRQLIPSDGDMIKGQGANSTYDSVAKEWVGTLRTLIPGQGYIYLRNGGSTTFVYQ